MYKREIVRIVVLCLLCSFFFSCKKKDSVNKVPFPFTEKMFHCQSNSYTKHGYYGYTQTNGDIVLRCYVENDSLRILNYVFPITTDNQNYFEIICGDNNYSQRLKIYFLNNHDSIIINYEELLYSSGYSGDRFSYTGVSTELRESTRPHAYRDELEGLYVLDVTYKNQCLGIDTLYVDTLQVNIDGNTIIFGSYTLSNSKIYHSHSEYNYNTDSPVFERIYWKEDSVRYYRLLPQNSSYCADTVLHIFQGRKL